MTCTACHSCPAYVPKVGDLCWMCHAVRSRTPEEVALLEDLLNSDLGFEWEQYSVDHVLFTAEGWFTLSRSRWKSWTLCPKPYYSCCRCGILAPKPWNLEDLTTYKVLDIHQTRYLLRLRNNHPVDERQAAYRHLTASLGAVCPHCAPAVRGILSKVKQNHAAHLQLRTKETPMSRTPRKTKINSSADLRRVLANALIDVRDGKLDVEKGNSMSRMAAQLNESVRLDLQAAVLLNRAGQTETAEGALLLTAGSTISKKLPFTPIPR